MPYTEKLGVFEQTKIDADERITSKGPVNHFDDLKTSNYAAIWNIQSLLSQAVLENATFAAFWSRAYLRQDRDKSRSKVDQVRKQSKCDDNLLVSKL